MSQIHYKSYMVNKLKIVPTKLEDQWCTINNNKNISEKDTRAINNCYEIIIKHKHYDRKGLKTRNK